MKRKLSVEQKIERERVILTILMAERMSYKLREVKYKESYTIAFDGKTVALNRAVRGPIVAFLMAATFGIPNVFPTYNFFTQDTPSADVSFAVDMPLNMEISKPTTITESTTLPEGTSFEEKIKELTNNLKKQIEDLGEQIESCSVRASSSDEWGELSKSLGVANEENVQLAKLRAQYVSNYLQSELEVKMGEAIGFENISVQSDFEYFENLAKSLGYEDFTHMESLYDANELPQEHRRMLLDASRNDRVVVVKCKSGTVMTMDPQFHLKTIVSQKDAPSVPFNKLTMLLSPLWLLALRRPKIVPARKTKEITTKNYKMIGKNTRFFKSVFKDPIENPDGTISAKELKPNPWLYTIKYRFLTIKDRLKPLFEFSNSNIGNNTNIKVFSAHSKPTDKQQETILAVLKLMSLIDNGEMTQRVNGICFFPKENCGGNVLLEANVGTGIDYQSDNASLAHLDFGLIEVILPTGDSQDELEILAHTLIHEFAHFMNRQESTLLVETLEENMISLEKTGREVSNDSLWLETLTQDYLKNRRFKKALYALSGLFNPDSEIVGFPNKYSTRNERENYSEQVSEFLTGNEIVEEQLEIILRGLNLDERFLEFIKPDENGISNLQLLFKDPKKFNELIDEFYKEIAVGNKPPFKVGLTEVVDIGVQEFPDTFEEIDVGFIEISR